MSGQIGRNLTVAGGNIELTPSARIQGAMVSAGGTVHLGAPLGRGARVAAGSLVVSNGIGGELIAAVGSLRIASGARISGNVRYYRGREASIDERASIAGTVTRRTFPECRSCRRRSWLGCSSGGVSLSDSSVSFPPSCSASCSFAFFPGTINRGLQHCGREDRAPWGSVLPLSS